MWQVGWVSATSIPAGNAAALMKPSGTLLNQAKLLSKACCMSALKPTNFAKLPIKWTSRNTRVAISAGEVDDGRR